MAKQLRITARPAAGFRRCGIHHPASPVDHPIDRFSELQLQALKNEPNLVVLELDAPATAPVPAPAAEKGKK